MGASRVLALVRAAVLIRGVITQVLARDRDGCLSKATSRKGREMVGEFVTMHDIARLARVERPVVSIWRRRYRRSSRPFPPAHTHHGDRELFFREEVVSWLEETERGNNPAARTEATAGALLADPRLADPQNLEALSALLLLRELLGTSLDGSEADDLLDAADGFDPDDTCLRRELEQAPDLSWLATAAEQLIAASWDVADAHQRLLAARLPGVTAQVLLSAAAVDLVSALVSPLLQELGSQARLLDATGCRFDLLPELGTATEAPLALLDGNTGAHRLNRRRLRLLRLAPVLVGNSPDWSVNGPTLNLVALPPLANPAADESSQLALLDNAALQLAPDQALLALAPAAVLSDPLAGEAGSQRDRLLRSGQVRAVVRLPAGLMPARVRESMALWLVTPPDPAPPADRRTMVADLSRLGLTATDIDRLGTDLLATLQGTDGARRRAWAKLRPALTTSLLAGDGSLVPPRPHNPAVAEGRLTGADWVVRLSGQRQVRLPDYRFGVAEGQAESVSLPQATRRGWLRMIPGRRFDPTQCSPNLVTWSS